MKPPEPHPGDDPGVGVGDTKVCPFCAEMIRAAAIKCRYCQSDLTGTTALPTAQADHPPPVPASAPVSPPSTTTPTATPTPTPTGSSAGTSRPRRLVWAVGALVALSTVALLLLALRDWQERRELDQATKTGEVARAAVTDKVQSLLSYRYETFDDDVTAAQRLLTPSFREEYAPTVAEIRRRAVAQRRDQQAEVLAVGLLSAEEDRARTLVFVNTVSARQGSERPATVMQNRVTVDLVRSDDGKDWLIDDLSFPTA